MTELLVSIEAYVLLIVYILVTIALAKLGSHLVVRLARRFSSRLPSGLVDFVGSLLRGLIWVVAALLVITEASITFGLERAIAESISSFLSANAGRFGVMLVIVVGGYIGLRIFGIVFVEYKRHSKLHPLTLDLFENIVHYVVYAIIAILLLANVLVMAGLETLAGTLVTLFAVFIGLVVSFAATGSIGNALSGIVVMSWRPYRQGDRVEIGGNVYGDVLEVDVMFTKIKTIKNEVVHVPNSQVLTNKIVNYSTMPKVIVHYQVTIGYDFPHSLVEELLLDSARITEGISSEPVPFVLIRDLDNNYVAYEINAYTDKPNQLITIYSALMRNVLERFAKAGVEILSPQHIAVRQSAVAVKRERTARRRS